MINKFIDAVRAAKSVRRARARERKMLLSLTVLERGKKKTRVRSWLRCLISFLVSSYIILHSLLYSPLCMSRWERARE